MYMQNEIEAIDELRKQIETVAERIVTRINSNLSIFLEVVDLEYGIPKPEKNRKPSRTKYNSIFPGYGNRDLLTMIRGEGEYCNDFESGFCVRATYYEDTDDVFDISKLPVDLTQLNETFREDTTIFMRNFHLKQIETSKTVKESQIELLANRTPRKATRRPEIFLTKKETQNE